MEDLKEYSPQGIEGKSVLITGGTTGIGRAAAVLLAKLGANVMIFGRYPQELEDALEDIKKSARGDMYGFTADVAEESAIQHIFKEVDDKFSNLDVLINNAAVGYGSVTGGTYKDWQYVVNTNLLGYMACAGEAINRMKQHGSGHIINIGSLSADAREVGSAVYVATKSALQGFCESLRKEVNPDGIKITLIEPGAVDTDMPTESKEEKEKKIKDLKMLTADDIAISILYCLSQPKRCDIIDIKIRPHLQEI